MFYIATGLFFIYIFLMALFTPHVGDDLKYPLAYNSYLIGESEFPGFGEWWEGIRIHFLSVNGRSGDKLLIGYLLLPQAIQALFAATGAAAMLISCCRLAFSKISSYAYSCMAMLVTIMLLMPWYDTMFVGCMLLNYAVGGGIALTALSLYFRPCKPWRKLRGLQYVLLVTLGFFAGSWHEGFTFITAPGILICLIMRRLSRTQAFVLAGLILGGIFIICNPGFWYRYEHKMQIFSMSDATSIFYISNMALLTLLAYPIVVIFPKLRKRYTSTDRDIMLTAMFAVIANAFIFVSNLSFPRVLWYGNLIGFIGLGCFLKVYSPRKILRLMLKFAVIAATIFCLAHETVCVIWQIKLDKEYKEVINLYRESPDGTVFYTQKASETLPWITLDRPSYQQFYGWRIDQWIPEFYRNSDEQLHVVPKELQDFNPQDAKVLNAQQKIYQYNGRYVVDASALSFKRTRSVFSTGKDNKRESYSMVCHKFRTEDGRLWYYLQTPDEEVLDSPRIQ